MAENKFSDKKLSGEQLEGVAGGTRLETYGDGDELYKRGLLTEEQAFQSAPVRDMLHKMGYKGYKDNGGIVNGNIYTDKQGNTWYITNASGAMTKLADDDIQEGETATDAAIRKAFREEIPDTTKLIIAQRVASVMDADRIIVLDAGRIAAMGTHEELLKSSSIYQEVYESQTKGGKDE